MSELIHKTESYEIIGVCMEVHRVLGHGFLEIVYKDAIEYECITRNIPYAREREFEVPYKNVVLRRKFYADFTVYDKVILEVKAAEGGIDDETVSRMINYLKVSGYKLGLIVNFARQKLEYKRIVY